MNRLTTRQRLLIFYPVFSMLLAFLFLLFMDRVFHNRFKREVAFTEGELQRTGLSQAQSAAVAARLYNVATDSALLAGEVGFIVVAVFSSTLIPITSAIVGLQAQSGSPEKKL